MHNSSYYLNIAKRSLAGDIAAQEIKDLLLNVDIKDTFQLLPGSDYLRRYFFGNKIHLCSIVNAKSGKCSEDCLFCTQSIKHSSPIQTYPLLEPRELSQMARQAAKTKINRFSIVTSGKKANNEDLQSISQALDEMRSLPLKTCASLGILNRDQLTRLKQSGLTRYHHNLETAASLFPGICSTHSYQERITTILEAKQAGLSVCSGGIFGLGESQVQVLELAQTLKDIDVDAVPVNFLTPVKGTGAESLDELSPMKCLKIIAMLRYMLPNKEIIICGGRSHNLHDLQNMIFYAGASGIMTGDYLTTQGNSLESDLAMLDRLHLSPKTR
jgi:biotin synthase